MAKKKEEPQKDPRDKELADLKAKVEEHQKAIEGFRESFANFEIKFRNLVERNRLR